MNEKVSEKLLHLAMEICLRCSSQPVLSSWWEPRDRKDAPDYCTHCEDKSAKLVRLTLSIPISLLNDEAYCKRRAISDGGVS